MAAIFGHKWTSAFGERCDDDTGALTIAGDTWARGLGGIPEIAIATGLSAALMSADPWPPTLPAFRAMCLNVPSFVEVRNAVSAKSRSPFITLVWQHLDAYRFAHSDSDTADRLLRGAYEISREHVMVGGELPPVPVADLEHKPAKPVRAAPEVARPYVDELAKLLGDPTPEPAA